MLNDLLIDDPVTGRFWLANVRRLCVWLFDVNWTGIFKYEMNNNFSDVHLLILNDLKNIKWTSLYFINLLVATFILDSYLNDFLPFKWQ